MTRKIVIAVMAVVMGFFSGYAHDRKALRINEVQVQNVSGIEDEYGEHHGWIELFNANFSPLEISSIYLTNDSTNPTKYPVPLGDVNTKIPKRQHVIFFVDGEPNKGTFHTNFRLRPGQQNWVGIYDADGKTLIDEVIIPDYLAEDESWARAVDGDGEWAIRTGGEDDYITPSSANVIRDTNGKIADFRERDKNGFAMTLMAMGVVFSALLILCLCFYVIGKINASVSAYNKSRAHGISKEEVRTDLGGHDSGEEIAAIAMALYQHLNAHDTESTVLTINKVKRAYSPWSSKIYGIRVMPEHRINKK